MLTFRHIVSVKSSEINITFSFYILAFEGGVDVVPELPIGIVLDQRPQLHSKESLKCPTEDSFFLHIFQKHVIR